MVIKESQNLGGKSFRFRPRFSCTDSDNGQTFDVKGIVTFNINFGSRRFSRWLRQAWSRTHTDYCSDTNIVVEYYLSKS